MKTFRLLLIPAVLSGLLAAPGARAATLTWEGDDSGDWATGTNWADGSAPAGNSGTPDVLNFGTVPAGGTKITNNNLTGDRHFNQLNFSEPDYIVSGNSVRMRSFNSSTPSIQVTHTTSASTVNVPITLDNDLTLNPSSTGILNLNSAISGAGNLVKDGSGLAILGGSVANTFIGTTSVSRGELRLSKSTGNAIPGDVTVGGGAHPASLTSTVAENIANTAVVTVEDNGALALGAFETITNLVINGGTVNTGANILAVNGNIVANENITISSPIRMNGSVREWTVAAGKTLSLDGTMTISPASTGITQRKLGTGILVVNGTTALTSFQIGAGTLRLENIDPANTLGISLDGGTLVGGGQALRISTVGGGTISPGTGTGSAILKASRLTVSNNVNLVIDINGSVPGTSHDQLAIGQTPVDNPSTSVVLNNANLQIRDSVSLPMGTVIRIIDNDQTDAISGTFAGLPAGSSITGTFNRYTISYTGGTGNDVTLTVDFSAANLSAAEVYTANTGLDLTDIVASAAGPVTVTLTLVNPGAGTLSTGTAGSATSTYNAVTGVWTVSGTAADVNSLLAALIFTPAADFNASFTIIASVSDGVTTFSGAKSMTETNGPAFSEFVDPNPNPGNQFGHSVVPLSTGNVVITSPFDDAGGTNAGAVYLFNGATGALISRLIGSSANDNVGFAGVTALSNGNLVVRSPNWDSGAVANAGAATFGSGITGVSGVVSASNSLVGSQANDQVGSAGVTVLSNGNYVVRSPLWDNEEATDAGAVTFASGTTGVSGVVSGSNSLMGSTASDQVGFSVFPLSTGNYVVLVSSWDNGAISNVGAVTFGSGVAGVMGFISESNSLVGSTAGDEVGSSISILFTGNYVVRSPSWDNGAITDVGAVTFCNGTAGVIGVVSASNSLVGSTAGDRVGSGDVNGLLNGNYVVFSPLWQNAEFKAVGAVTFGNGTTGLSGVVTESNSLVGSTDGDLVGSSTAILNHGNYVVRSPSWDNGAVANVGAATFGNGTTGVSGVISASNSLVGSSAGDRLGSSAVIVLFNGNYVVRAPLWDNGPLPDVGAATFGSGTTGVSGVVSESNSLVGSSAGDQVGTNVTALVNGNYVVGTPFWDNGAITDVGAVTFGSGTIGVTSIVSESNSLVGSSAGDQVGLAVDVLSNGNYVVRSPSWDNGSVPDAGAVTFCSGTTGVIGVVSESNSLVGSTASDLVGSAGVSGLFNGNYVVRSPLWDNGAVTNAGAVTFCSGTTGLSGVVSSDNSLVGTTASDTVGSGGVVLLSNGNYVVRSPLWDNEGATDAGAVTFGSGISGVSGMMNFANSSLGQAANALLQPLVVDTVNGNFFARFRNEGSGKVRVGSIETGFAHLVRKITVFTGDSTEPEDSRTNGLGTLDFGSLAGGISAAQVFTIRNSGVDPLTDLAVSATGVNGGNYAVNTSGMESSLAPGETATFTVTFAPTVTTSGLLPALVEIASNAVDETPFVIPVTGMFFSPASDMDGDGLDDASEVKLSQFGFDPHVNQAELVAALFGNLGGAQANLNAVGYFTAAQVRELHINTPLIQRNPGSGEFTLTLGLEKSTTLQPGSFQPFPFSAPDTSVNGQGKIEFQFTVPDNAAFFRLQTE